MALLIGIATLLAGCVSGWAIRYFVIEPDNLQALCAGSAAAAWCGARAFVIAATFTVPLGPAAAGAGAAAWLLRGRMAAILAVLALLAGGLGLYLYDTGWAAAGVLAALLRLPRVSEDAPDPREFSA